MGFIEHLARAGVVLSDLQLAEIAAAKRKQDDRVKEILHKFKTIRAQAERIAYLEQRVFEQREEIRNLRNEL